MGRLAPLDRADYPCPPSHGGQDMNTITTSRRQPWNKGKLVGQKAPLRLKDIWAIRVRLQIAQDTRDLALFDLAIDSKLRACDLTKHRVCDVAHARLFKRCSSMHLQWKMGIRPAKSSIQFCKPRQSMQLSFPRARLSSALGTRIFPYLIAWKIFDETTRNQYIYCSMALAGPGSPYRLDGFSRLRKSSSGFAGTAWRRLSTPRKLCSP